MSVTKREIDGDRMKRREKRAQNIKIFETNFQRDGTRKDYCIIYVSRGE